MNTVKQQMIGESPLLIDLLEHLSQVAPLNKPVLVLGERGTGKELIAERLHFLSNRWDGPFIKLNCASMSETLLESELFGHESGAFTGANRQHKGRFERADGGTLFLDELATCSQRVQEKLLRVIEYGELERVGGHKTIQVDVRLVAATNADLITMSQNGEFRADLLDRLAFDVLHIPPLRLREGDIALLANHFAIAMSNELERPLFSGFSRTALEQLNTYDWPGNIRELRNVIERSVYRHEEPEELIDDIVIDPFQKPWSSRYQTTAIDDSKSDNHNNSKTTPDLSDFSKNTDDRQLNTATNSTTDTTGMPDKTKRLLNSSDLMEKLEGNFQQQIEQLERRLIEQALQQNQYHQQKSAEALGLSYHQLRAQLKKHNMLPLKNQITKNQAAK